MKILACLSIIFTISIQVQAQKYYTKEGKISFLSETPLEIIEATNQKAVSIFDSETGAIEWSVLIKAFNFEKALMQEHFNENYMESSKYPKSKFKGTILNMKDIDLKTDGTYNLQIAGMLDIHGVSKEIESEATFVISKGQIKGLSSIQVNLADYNIDIPSVVADKLAKAVDIDIIAEYQLFKQ